MSRVVFVCGGTILATTSGDAAVGVGDRVILRVPGGDRIVYTAVSVSRGFDPVNDIGSLVTAGRIEVELALVEPPAVPAAGERPPVNVTEVWAAVRYRVKKGQTGTAAFIKALLPGGTALFAANVREAQLFPGVLGRHMAAQAALDYPYCGGDTHGPSEVVTVRVTTRSLAVIEVIELPAAAPPGKEAP